MAKKEETKRAESGTGPAFNDLSSDSQTTSLDPVLPTLDGAWASACSDLVIVATRLQEQLPPSTRRALAPILARMNCFYSNLIEGHKTYPDEVDRAEAGASSASPGDQRRLLVAEASAHIRSQGELRKRLAEEPAWDPTHPEALAWLHQVFYSHLPEEFRWIETRTGSQRIPIVPGAWRDRAVAVGNHVPPEARALPAFLARFHEAYRGCLRPNPETIAKIAASHHRFVWIHPYLDGNGRVARLLTDALVERCDLGADGLWCVGRGFARQLDRYRGLLAGADLERQGATDGRGPRTQAGLDRWCAFVLEVMADQVSFMHGLIQPKLLRERIGAWADRESAQGRLHPRAGRLIAETVTRGEVGRTEAVEFLRLTDRYGREQLKKLIDQGYFTTAERKPLCPAFPLRVVPWWFPDLFPGDVEERLVRRPEN